MDKMWVCRGKRGAERYLFIYEDKPLLTPLFDNSIGVWMNSSAKICYHDWVKFCPPLEPGEGPVLFSAPTRKG